MLRGTPFPCRHPRSRRELAMLLLLQVCVAGHACASVCAACRSRCSVLILYTLYSAYRVLHSRLALALSPPHPRCVSVVISSSLRECVRRFCNPHPCFVSALDKLGSRHLFINSIPEPVRPNAAFDIASLVLYGCQALPIRLKILLDRLFSALHKEQVIQVLHGFGWTQEDYARGYILQVSGDKSVIS